MGFMQFSFFTASGEWRPIHNNFKILLLIFRLRCLRSAARIIQ
jgi:hypothetical protein